jgi:twitching motility protein PilT
MKPIEELLQSLGKPEVLEFGLVTNRLPSVNIDGKFAPVDDEAPTTDQLLQMLVAMGGGRHVEQLSERPVKWTARLDGVGVIAIAAIMRKDIVQARFTVARRDVAVKAEAPTASSSAAAMTGQSSPQGAELARAQGDLGDVLAKAPVLAPSAPKVQRGPSAKNPQPSPPPPPALPFDVLALGDDDEPTVQTASPPVARPQQRAPGAAVVPRPKAHSPAVDTVDEAPRRNGTLESYLAMAVAARASDLHVVAGRPVSLRIASELAPRTPPVDAEHVERLAREIVPERLRERLALDGACDFAIDHAQHGRFRVNVSRQRTGFKLCLRVIPREIPTLAGLALPEGIAAAATYARGLVLITGPAGHGKTTTLAALVDIFNRDTARHVVTIEDPIELVHSRKRAMISQREIGTHARSWASALAGALREDADVIVVGELRDAETLRAAIGASETGHLVIGTMCTPSAAMTVERIVDVFPRSEQARVRGSLANALRLVVGQRLVPSADRARLHAAVELLPSSSAVAALIREGRMSEIGTLQQRGRSLAGAVGLDESLAALARDGKVSLADARQFAGSTQALEAAAARKA